MTLFEKTLSLFTSTQKSTTDFELLQLNDIINSISTNSNNWNKAATLFSSDNEQSLDERITLNVTSQNLKHPYLSTNDLNKLALELSEQNRK